MRASVSSQFREFTQTFEGDVAWMYPDIEGFITTGIGNLIDPLPLAQSLPWHRIIDGYPASRDEIAEEWHRMKANRALAAQGAEAARRLATLAISASAIDMLVRNHLDADVATIKGQAEFATFDGWPADAQLGLLSMAWAQGADFHGWPRFRRSAAASNFYICALECTLDETGNRGLIPRNAANRALFRSAASVVASAGDRDVLHWDDVKTDLHARRIL